MEVCFKMPSLKAKLTLSAFYWNMGAVLKIHSFSFTFSFCRIDAKVATEEKEKSPLKIALERDNTEIVVLLCEATGEEVPDKVKLEQLSKAMYKEEKEGAKNEFSKILASLSPDLVSFFKSWI